MVRFEMCPSQTSVIPVLTMHLTIFLSWDLKKWLPMGGSTPSWTPLCSTKWKTNDIRTIVRALRINSSSWAFSLFDPWKILDTLWNVPYRYVSPTGCALKKPIFSLKHATLFLPFYYSKWNDSMSLSITWNSFLWGKSAVLESMSRGQNDFPSPAKSHAMLQPCIKCGVRGDGGT